MQCEELVQQGLSHAHRAECSGQAGPDGDGAEAGALPE